MNKIILGLDPGIADTGYGVISVDNGKLICLDFGSIKTSAKDDLADRLVELDRELNKIIKKYQPDVVAIEKIFFNNNAKTALIVGQARGVLLLGVKKNNIKLIEFTPLQVKQGVCNFGRSDKNQVKKMVKLILNLKELPRSDDAADALAIAICASNINLNNIKSCQKK
jgi:crossover junction endodeoxyribonuclease RuvC